MKYLIILFWFFFFIPGVFGLQEDKTEYPFKEKYSHDSGSCDLAAKMEIENAELETGRKYSVRYTVNAGVFCPIYNPFFNGLIPPPGQLALYDEDKQYVVNLTRRFGGSRRGPGKADWVYMYSGFIGGRLGFRLSRSFLEHPSAYLTPGTYYLQLIFYESFNSPCWEDIVPAQDVSFFYKNYSRKELLRSNAIKIKIQKRSE